ncbi:hypothetical protein V6R86_09205 [Sphingomonas kaistensis]|jgi:hypothetical protein|uniref:DUF4384 domain-containing protein n=1 Tax=Sphingomonas kaistensis TaxID=298708 RepID=A0ABZ2G4W0_9SPHN
MKLQRLTFLAAAVMQPTVASAEPNVLGAAAPRQVVEKREEKPGSYSFDARQLELTVQRSFKASLALQYSTMCANAAAETRIRLATQRTNALEKIAVEKLGGERFGFLLADTLQDPRNIYLPGCPSPAEFERRIQSYEKALEELSVALGSPALPAFKAPLPAQQTAELPPAGADSQIKREASPTPPKQGWIYSEQGGDPIAYPGPNAWFQSVGFTCQPQRVALTYQETPFVYSDDKTEFSIRVGSVTWTGPAKSKGHTISADIPLSHSVIDALAKPQRGTIAVRFGPYPYEIPHDSVVLQRVVSECRIKVGIRGRL